MGVFNDHIASNTDSCCVGKDFFHHLPLDEHRAGG